MTFLEALKQEKIWHKRALMINFYHNLMLLKKKNWNMRKTAKRLEISLGMVSESIKLAKAVVDNKEIEMMTRKNALQKIKS